TAGRLGNQCFRERLADFTAIDQRRSVDGALERAAIHRRHEILRTIDRFGQALEASTFAEEFRPHGDDDMNARGLIALAFPIPVLHTNLQNLLFGAGTAKQKINEELSLLAARLLFKPKQFLELINQNAQALTLGFAEQTEDG